MSTNYPTSIDTFEIGAPGEFLGAKHLTNHRNLSDAVVALETKLGIDASTNPASVDYLLRHAKRVTKNANATLTAAEAGSLVDVSANATLTLPTSPVDGMRFAFIATTNNTLTVNPGTASFMLGSVTFTAGDTAVARGRGSFLAVVYISGLSAWVITAIEGAWRIGDATALPYGIGLAQVASVNAGSTSEQEFTTTRRVIKADALVQHSALRFAGVMRVAYGMLETPTLHLRIRAGGVSGTLIYDAGEVAAFGGDRNITLGVTVKLTTGGASAAFTSIGQQLDSGVRGAVTTGNLNITTDQTFSLTAQFGSGGSASTVLTLYDFILEHA